MDQISFRIPDDIRDEFERGRKAQGLSGVSYFTALVLRARKRVSGLSEPVWESAATDAQLSAAVAAAVAALQGEPEDERKAAAIDHLRDAQRIIIRSLSEKRTTVNKAVSERIRVRRGSDDWA